MIERRPQHAIRSEVATAGRFLVVGLFNTAIGYAFILAALFLGAGDYLANACAFIFGLPIAYFTQRRFTFTPEDRASASEGMRYALSVLVAYTANLGVLTAGRHMGYAENPWVQLLAVVTYAGVLFVLSRLVVFRQR